MAGIKQTVPNYIFGASNQSDQLKIPGFVSEAVNIYPDVTEGCEKRPGTRHINTLIDVGATSYWPQHTWFALDYGGDEQFIGKVETLGNVRIWECATGIEYMVVESDSAADYLTHFRSEDLQTLTINDTTYIVNRRQNTSMDFSGEYNAPKQGNKAYIDLSTIAYGKQYSLDIVWDDSALNAHPQNTSRATKLSIQWEPGGSARDDPDNDSGRNVDGEESCRYNTREIRTINAGRTRTWTHTARFADGDGIYLPGKNLRFKVSMIGTPYIAGYHGSRDGEPYYWALYDIDIELLHGGEGWRKGDSFQIIIGDEEAGGSTKHTVTVEEVEVIETTTTWLIRPEPTTHDGSQVLTAEKILNDIKSEIEYWTGNSGPATDGGIDVVKIGSGLLLSWSEPFTVSTPEGNLMSIIGGEVSSAADLPSQCQDGYVVKVSNSSLDEDDYWLKYERSANTWQFNASGGKGVWVETVRPNSNIMIRADSMPHQIVKSPGLATGGRPYGFRVGAVAWEDRLTGDDKTNPRPLFLRGDGSYEGQFGSPISNMLFWRNRLVLLSKNSICLTQPLKDDVYVRGSAGSAKREYVQVFNVWAKSAIALSPGDAIDIVATSNQVCDLKHGIEVNAGLMLFSEYEQFLLTTDSDVVTPETVKVKRVSSWSYDQACSPISLGNSIAFCDDAGRHSRLFEMSNITRETEPLVTELSKPITESIPTGIKSIAESPENGLVVLAHHSPYDDLNPDPIGDAAHCNSPYDYVYVYKYFTSGNKRIQSAWFKWKFPGRVLWHTIIGDTYYLILDNDTSDVRLLAMDLTRKEETFTYGAISERCQPHRIHLDEMVDVTGKGWYDGKWTRYPIPGSLYAGSRVTPGTKWIVYTAQGRGSRFIAANHGGEAYILGDHEDAPTIMGIAYDMKLKLPQIYPTKKAGDAYSADTTSTLTIHRCKFSMGTSGDFSVNVNLKGGESYSIDFESNTNHTFYTNVDNIIPSQIVDVPVYQPNTDFRLEFESNNPDPCTLNSMTWEGDYNTLYRSA